MLEAIRATDLTRSVRFYQASTSELYGKVEEIPQSETTPFHPRSPYGVAKLYGFWAVKNYRRARGAAAHPAAHRRSSPNDLRSLHACTLVLHTAPGRPLSAHCPCLADDTPPSPCTPACGKSAVQLPQGGPTQTPCEQDPGRPQSVWVP